MADPHNPKRAGELWDQSRIDIQLAEISKIKDYITLSGGWAWHFISPIPHKEIKTQHDHKDIDCFIDPNDFVTLLSWFKNNGYERQHTIYDNQSGKFYRYTKFYEGGKIVFDLFLENVSSVLIKGFKVVDPITLLSYYGVKHTSDLCLAVVEAKKLVSKGIDPIDRPELIYV